MCPCPDIEVTVQFKKGYIDSRVMSRYVEPELQSQA